MSVKQDMEAMLWSNGCDLETAKFTARMLEKNGFALVKVEYLESIGTPFASCHSHEEACERLRRINSATYSGVPSEQVTKGSMPSFADKMTGFFMKVNEVDG